MIGEGGGARFPAMVHVYVEDADAVYERTLAVRASSVAEPHDTSFGTQAPHSTTAGAISGGSLRAP